MGLISKSEITVDKNNLYREESYTDMKVASIKKLIPIKSDGTPDLSRQQRFTGYSQVVTPGGPIPINFIIEANTFEEAMDKFPEALELAVQQMIEELKEIENEQASRIIIPGLDPSGKMKLM